MTAPEEQPVAPVEETAAKRKLEESAASEAEPVTQEKTEEPAAKKPKTEEDVAKKEPETPAAPVKRSKGKGRSKIAQRYASEPEDEEDDEDDEEEEVIDEHRIPEGDVEEDDLAEIDTSNIIVGRRTRGKVIDYKKINDELEKSKAAGEVGLLDDDDDEEENDKDFQDKE
ncbi:hypothetical protein DV495_003166 [Geotrichum candidum]|uniref:Histone H2A.Z-specific chaperone CHZ1 n=1 Tax=Geotrichum candidum TaxID=1173061 RepID=A0A0J9X6H0_GEOCN|nr:hypothetical protein DV452_003515 [Geotrichum candidum]KAI9210246.1 hypothetical protein DS838_004871 [Geotrichum bryndzae]KAF5126825.1 hypothetical protein DV495_003166 [Geotrichum candidum]KAF7499259.1 hypothetical protein DV113_002677 [Geotrichum candidum]KAI8135924.1 hypothetical protein DUD61_000347 [Geotrichum candidum]